MCKEITNRELKAGKDLADKLVDHLKHMGSAAECRIPAKEGYIVAVFNSADGITIEEDTKIEKTKAERKVLDKVREMGIESLAPQKINQLGEIIDTLISNRHIRVPICCYIDKDGKQCLDEAEFEIMDNNRNDPDNYTHSCTKHVGEMLGTTENQKECKNWNVCYIGDKK